MSDFDSENEAENHSFLESQLDRLDAIHQTGVCDARDIEVMLRAELEVYENVIPTYEIQQPSKAEERLIYLYKQFLLSLIAMVDKSNTSHLRKIGADLIADLARFAAAFNHNRTLLSVTVRCANDETLPVSEPCVSALKHLIASDASSKLVLTLLDELTDVLQEAKSHKHQRKNEIINQRLLRVLVMIQPKHVDMHKTIHENTSEKKSADTLPLPKELKRKRSKIDKKMQGIHQTEVAGDIASIQSGLFQKIMYILLDLFKECASSTTDRRREVEKIASDEATILIILQGLTKFGEYSNAELVDLLMQALWDHYQAIEQQVEKGANISSGSTQIQFDILAALHRYMLQRRQLSALAPAFTGKPHEPLNASRVPQNALNLQREVLRLIENAFAAPVLSNSDLDIDSKSNLLVQRSQAEGNEKNAVSGKVQRFAQATLSTAARITWIKLVDHATETIRVVFAVEKKRRSAIATRHKRHRVSASSEYKEVFEKLIGFAMNAPPYISQRLDPLVDAFVETLSASVEGVRQATEDDAPAIGDTHSESFWLVFAYRRTKLMRMKLDKKAAEGFKWMVC